MFNLCRSDVICGLTKQHCTFLFLGLGDPAYCPRSCSKKDAVILRQHSSGFTCYSVVPININKRAPAQFPRK